MSNFLSKNNNVNLYIKNVKFFYYTVYRIVLAFQQATIRIIGSFLIFYLITCFSFSIA